MALKMNSLSEDIICEDLARGLKVIDKFHDQSLANPEDNKTSYRVARTSSQMGYMYYQQEQPEDSKKYFSIAAKSSANDFFYQPAPTEGYQTKNPWAFIKAIHIAGCFGGQDDIKQISQVEEVKYHNYPTEQDKQECQFLADYVAVLKTYLVTGSIANDPLSHLLKAASETSRSKDEKHFIVPLVKGLNALVNEDQEQWNLAIQDAVNAHVQETKSGDYRKSEEGFICMPGLLLVKLGISKGWKTNVESLYLPVLLLES